MIHTKYKAAHYAVNQFKTVAQLEQWFERETSIYTEAEIYELWTYVSKRSEKELIHLAKCSDAMKEREICIINTADLLRYCYGNIQMVLLNIIKQDFPMP